MAEERIQRRLAAIMVVDMVAYSRRMNADEAGTLALLQACRKEFIEPLARALILRLALEMSAPIQKSQQVLRKNLIKLSASSDLVDVMFDRYRERPEQAGYAL